MNEQVVSTLYDGFEFDENAVCDLHVSPKQDEQTRKYLDEMRKKEKLASLALKMADLLERLAVKDRNGNVCGIIASEGYAEEMNALLNEKNDLVG